MTTSEEDTTGEWLPNLCCRLDEKDAAVTEVDIRLSTGHIWSDSDSMVLSDSLPRGKNNQVTRLSLRNLKLGRQGALIKGPAIKNSTSLLTLERKDYPDSEGHVAETLARFCSTTVPSKSCTSEVAGLIHREPLRPLSPN
jgi:hypothetical protein